MVRNRCTFKVHVFILHMSQFSSAKYEVRFKLVRFSQVKFQLSLSESQTLVYLLHACMKPYYLVLYCFYCQCLYRNVYTNTSTLCSCTRNTGESWNIGTTTSSDTCWGFQCFKWSCRFSARGLAWKLSYKRADPWISWFQPLQICIFCSRSWFVCNLLMWHFKLLNMFETCTHFIFVNVDFYRVSINLLCSS